MTVLDEHRETWARKPSLARLYAEEYFARIDRWAPPGRRLEIGSGPGFLKEYMPSVVSLDIMEAHWLDVQGDCQALPFRDDAFDAIVGLDVLHHLPEPLRFLEELGRVVRPGGRLVLVEPWRSPFASLVYTRFHAEDFDLSWTPDSGATATGDEPFDGNQAVPYLVFERHWQEIGPRFPRLQIVQIERFAFFSYLMSGGFTGLNLLPPSLYGPVLAAERRTTPLWRRAAALRALIVVEVS